MEKTKSLSFFEGRKVRKTWFNDEWWFVVEDAILALTYSSDPKQYINKLRQRDKLLSQGWVRIVHTLPFPTSGGIQNINCSNTEGLFRIIQSIPSTKAEPFKLWLAKVGYERVKEIENPELVQERMKELYEQKGYSKEWIDKRLRGISIRQELTEEWKQRGLNKQVEYAILTNEISKATFGKTVEEYKQFKALNKENLRDHMDDLELIFTMLGEKVTTEITKNEDKIGFVPCHDAAQRGGGVSGKARLEIEKEICRPIVSADNYLSQPEKIKRSSKKELK